MAVYCYITSRFGMILRYGKYRIFFFKRLFGKWLEGWLHRNIVCMKFVIKQYQLMSSGKTKTALLLVVHLNDHFWAKPSLQNFLGTREMGVVEEHEILPLRRTGYLSSYLGGKMEMMCSQVVKFLWIYWFRQWKGEIGIYIIQLLQNWS